MLCAYSPFLLSQAGVASAGSSRAELNAVGFLLGVLDIYAKEFVVDRAGEWVK